MTRALWSRRGAWERRAGPSCPVTPCPGQTGQKGVRGPHGGRSPAGPAKRCRGSAAQQSAAGRSGGLDSLAGFQPRRGRADQARQNKCRQPSPWRQPGVAEALGASARDASLAPAWRCGGLWAAARVGRRRSSVGPSEPPRPPTVLVGASARRSSALRLKRRSPASAPRGDAGAADCTRSQGWRRGQGRWGLPDAPEDRPPSSSSPMAAWRMRIGRVGRARTAVAFRVRATGVRGIHLEPDPDRRGRPGRRICRGSLATEGGATSGPRGRDLRRSGLGPRGRPPPPPRASRGAPPPTPGCFARRR
jgi:hypothetical protein